jgi:hypothetical protein
MDVNLNTPSRGYSTLKEQGEHYEFLNAEGQEVEPNSYETISYANGKPKKVKSGSVKQQRAKIASQRAAIAKQGPLVKKTLKRSAPIKKATSVGGTMPKKGLSLGAKIGIGVGVAALLGVGIYFIVKRKK